MARWQGLATTLGGYPFHQLWFGVGPLPYAVIHAGVFRVDRVTAGFPPCRDTLTRHRHRNSLVGVSVEVPKRGVNRPRAILSRFTSATDHCCGERRWTIRDHIPDARASHRLTRYVNVAVVDRELAAQSIHNLQRQPRPIAQASWGIVCMSPSISSVLPPVRLAPSNAKNSLLGMVQQDQRSIWSRVRAVGKPSIACRFASSRHDRVSNCKLTFRTEICNMTR